MKTFMTQRTIFTLVLLAILITGRVLTANAQNSIQDNFIHNVIPPIAADVICSPLEWQCTDTNVTNPLNYCPCTGQACPPPAPETLGCRTAQDRGQKDGTGFTEDARQYLYFDFDLRRIIPVPPVIGTVTNQFTQGNFINPGFNPGNNPGTTGNPGDACIASCPIFNTPIAVNHCENQNHGVDFLSTEGTPVYAGTCGIVLEAGWSGNDQPLGYHVVIEGEFRHQYFFGNLSPDILVQKGDVVTTNTMIGTVGPQCLAGLGSECYTDPTGTCVCSNGLTSGPKLHYEIRRFDAQYDQNDCTLDQVDPTSLLPTECGGI